MRAAGCGELASIGDVVRDERVINCGLFLITSVMIVFIVLFWVNFRGHFWVPFLSRFLPPEKHAFFGPPFFDEKLICFTDPLFLVFFGLWQKLRCAKTVKNDKR